VQVLLGSGLDFMVDCVQDKRKKQRERVVARREREDTDSSALFT
jgi:hypothetical protein